MNYISLNSIITAYLIYLCYEFMVYYIISRSFKLKMRTWKVYLFGFLFSSYCAIVTALSNYYLGSGIIEETQSILIINKLLLIIGELLIILFIVTALDVEWYKCYWLTIIAHIVLIFPITYYTNNFLHDYNDKVIISPVNLNSLIEYLTSFLLIISLGCLFIYLLRYIKISDKVNKFPKFIWPFVYTIWLLFVLFTPKYFSNRNRNNIKYSKMFPYNDLFPLLIEVIAVSIILIYIIINYTNQRFLKREIKLLKEQNNIQYENYLLLQQKDSQIHKLYHDIGNHITTIQLLMENDENQEAKTYTENLVNVYKEIKKQYYCNNPIINAVLLQKLRLCDQNNISYTIEIKLPDIIEIRGIDLMSVFSNLLDNAIESCLRNTLSENYIKLAVSTIGDYLSIKVINSKLNGSHMNKSIFSTSKRDKFQHGYGIKIIDEIVERNNGQKEFKDNGNEFSAFVMLKSNNNL